MAKISRKKAKKIAKKKTGSGTGWGGAHVQMARVRNAKKAKKKKS